MDEDCVSTVAENTSLVVDLDIGDESNPDAGLDLCLVRDRLKSDDGIDTTKINSVTLSLSSEDDGTLATNESSNPGDTLKFEGDSTSADDGNDAYRVVLSGKDDPADTSDMFFDGTVLQRVNFHTSCSAPIAIGDGCFGVQVNGASFADKNTGETFSVCTSDAAGDADVIYAITGGADAAQFEVDAATGKVSFNETPDFDNRRVRSGDNKHDLEINSFFIDANDAWTSWKRKAQSNRTHASDVSSSY